MAVSKSLDLRNTRDIIREHKWWSHLFFFFYCARLDEERRNKSMALAFAT